MTGPEWRDMIDGLERVSDQIGRIEDKLDARLRMVETRIWFITGFLAAGEIVLGIVLSKG